jgi:hypothetical protein
MVAHMKQRFAVFLVPLLLSPGAAEATDFYIDFRGGNALSRGYYGYGSPGGYSRFGYGYGYQGPGYGFDYPNYYRDGSHFHGGHSYPKYYFDRPYDPPRYDRYGRPYRPGFSRERPGRDDRGAYRARRRHHSLGSPD